MRRPRGSASELNRPQCNLDPMGNGEPVHAEDGDRGWSALTTFWGCFGGRFFAIIIMLMTFVITCVIIDVGPSLGYDKEVWLDLLDIEIVAMASIWLALKLYGRRFLDYPTRYDRTYPTTSERVDTAVRLLLASRDWDFERVAPRAGFLRSDRFHYRVSMMVNEDMEITLGPNRGGGTDLRLFLRFDSKTIRTDLQAAIDAAVETPYELDLVDALETMGQVRGVDAARLWKVSRARFPLLGLWGTVLVGVVLSLLLAVGGALYLTDTLSFAGFFLPVLAGSVLVLLAMYAFSEWAEGLYEYHNYRGERTYPLDLDRVDTAVGLLLASRRAEFKRSVQRGRFRKPDGFRYGVSKLDGKCMVITLRPRKGGGTDLRLFYDIMNEARRMRLQATIDAAVESPCELDFLGAEEADERPDLRVFEG